MIPANLSPVANHLWQSTLFAAAAWLLTLVLRKNYAGVRYRLWLAASVKFLIPFALLVGAGSQFAWRTSPAMGPTPVSLAMEQISQPFALPVDAVPAVAAAPLSNPVPAPPAQCLVLRLRNQRGRLVPPVATFPRGHPSGDGATFRPTDSGDDFS